MSELDTRHFERRPPEAPVVLDFDGGFVDRSPNAWTPHVNTVSYTGGCIYNDGTKIVTITDPGTGSNLDLAQYSVCFWIKMPTGQTIYTNPIYKGGAGSLRNYCITLYVASGLTTIYGNYANGSYINCFDATPIAYDTWTHFAYTFATGVGSKLYRNSVLTVSNAATTAPVQGNEVLSISSTIKGYMDDVIIFKRPITQAEIDEIYNNSKYKERP